MKARKILCVALSLMLILTSFPFLVFANVTELEAQPALFEIDFDDYTESFISSDAQGSNNVATYEDLKVPNYNSGKLNLTLTPIDRDGGKAIAYSAESGTNDKASTPDIRWNDKTYTGEALAFSADLNFSADTDETGRICDIQAKSVADSKFISASTVFAFVRTEGGVYLTNAGAIVESAEIPDGWHSFDMVINTIDCTVSMYMDDALLSICDLNGKVELSKGVVSPRFGALSIVPFSFDNLRIGNAKSGFCYDYDNTSFNIGDTYVFDVYVKDFDFGSRISLYADDILLDSTQTKVASETYRFESTVSSDVALGATEFKLVAEKGGKAVVIDSFPAKVTYASAPADVTALNTFDASGAKALGASAQNSHVAASTIVDANGSKAMAAYVKHTLDASETSKKAATASKSSHATAVVSRVEANTRNSNLYVIEEDLWFGSITDSYHYECQCMVPVDKTKFYKISNGTATGQTNVLGLWKTYVLSGGKIGTMNVEANKWYSVKTVFDFDNKKSYIYVDGELVTATEGVGLAYTGTNGTYYYNDGSEAATTSNSTKIDESNVNNYLALGVTGINGYHTFGSSLTSYSASTDTGYENYYKVLMRDNLHVYTQIPVPVITSFTENVAEASTVLNITLDSPYDAASVASKNGIKVYKDGVETDYTSATIAGNVVTITLSEPAEANTKLDVVFLTSLLLKDGETPAGALNKATFYVTKNDIYLTSDVTFAGGKANAKLVCKNYGQASGNVLVALAGKADNELKVIDADEFALADGFELDLSVNTAESDTVLVTIWKDMVPLTVATPVPVAQ